MCFHSWFEALLDLILISIYFKDNAVLTSIKLTQGHIQTGVFEVVSTQTSAKLQINTKLR